MNKTQIQVVIRHHRIDQATGQMMPFRSGISTWKPASRGGWTECLFYEVPIGKVKDRDQWGLKARAIAVCSLQDNYSKKIGSRIAQGRAGNLLSSLPVLQPDYKHIWQALIKLRHRLARLYQAGRAV